MRDVLHIDLLIVARRAVAAPSAGLALYDRFGTMVFSAGTGQLRHRLPALAPGGAIVVRLDLRLSVQPGEYTFTLGTSEPGCFHDWHEQVGPIEVVPLRPGAGRSTAWPSCRWKRGTARSPMRG